jgi:spoIIIJ-associated protein
MKKIESKTLEEAYAVATEAFNCSITALDCEIIQYPSSGFLGLFSKNAIIVVAPKKKQEEKISDTVASKNSVPEKKKSISKDETPKQSVKAEQKAEKVTQNSVTEKKKSISKDEAPKQSVKAEQKAEKGTANSVTKRVVLDSFFDEKREAEGTEAPVQKPINNIPLQEEIEKELKALIALSCFDIDTVEVDVIEDTAYVFIDGEDAALLIGKEGYRYNALSYLVSNWLQNKHALYIKLEIAQFLATQQEMIRSYMEPVIEHVEQEGWGRTRALDGILVQIALEQLREAFPNKYVAIKRTRNGDRYVLINEFNKR